VAGTDAGYGMLVPGLIVSGVGQGIVWTAMWIASATATHEQGIANGLATFTAIADIGTEGKTGQALRAATAEGKFLVVLLIAAAMVAGLLVTLALRHRPTTATPQDEETLAIG
jgi:hypothetical protein